MSGQTLHSPSSSRLIRRARLLAALSVTYNVVEAVVALVAGNAADSGALISFGLDSLVEVSSGLVILWQFRHPFPLSREKLASRLIAMCFFALALYVGLSSLISLATGAQAQPSLVGVYLAIASLIVMPALALAQRATGRKLSSNSVVADSKQTLLCVYLSAVLLLGLVANAWLDWWWADPIAALTIAALAGWEGYRTWQGEQCCSVDPSLAHSHESVDADAATGAAPALCPHSESSVADHHNAILDSGSASDSSSSCSCCSPSP